MAIIASIWRWAVRVAVSRKSNCATWPSRVSRSRIIATDAKNASGAISVAGVEAGHQLGFFLVPDGPNTLGSALNSSSLSIVNQNGHLAPANDGTVIGGGQCRRDEPCVVGRGE